MSVHHFGSSFSGCVSATDSGRERPVAQAVLLVTKGSTARACAFLRDAAAETCEDVAAAILTGDVDQAFELLDLAALRLRAAEFAGRCGAS